MPGSMATPSTAISAHIKPTRTKPAISNIHKLKAKSAPTKLDNKKGKAQQFKKRMVTPAPAVNNVKPTVRNVKLFNATKPANTRGLQAPTIKTKPDISTIKNRVHLNKVNKTPVIFNKGVVAPIIKSGPGNNAHSVLGGKGFVPANNAYKAGSGKSWQSVQEEYTGTSPIIKEINIPFAFFANEMQSAFQDTKVHLNNYGPRHGNSWYKVNDSFVELPAVLGGAKQNFSFPVKNAFPFRYYMKNVNLSSIQVNSSQGRLAIEFNFESNGKEIKGRCSNSYLCVLGSDLSAPDVQMNNAKASVYLTPAARNGSISFSQIASDFTADIQAQGACNVIGISYVCNALTDYKHDIKNSAKQAIKNAVDSDSIRNKIAEKMRLKLVSYGIRDVISVDVLSNILVIKHRVQQGQMTMQ
jgi:hypothetical protein